MDRRLVELAQFYRSSGDRPATAETIRAQVSALSRRFARDREAALIDAAAAAGAVHGIFSADRIDFSRVTPQMQEAWDAAYPSVPLVSIVNRDSEQVAGFINGWKGKYFEVLVRDKLNAGESVGDVGLASGQSAVLAESPVQPGWDLRILEPDGSEAGLLQLKAAASLGPVRKALERYPDIDILATDEAASAASEWTDQVIASGMSEQELEDAVAAPLESLLDSSAMELLEDALPFAPLIPFIIISVGEGRQVMVGRKSFESGVADGMRRALDRGVKMGAAMGVGALVFWMDGGVLSLPATVLTRLGIDRMQRLNRLETRLENRTKELLCLKDAYTPLLTPDRERGLSATAAT